MAFRYNSSKDLTQAAVTANKTLAEGDAGVAQVVTATSTLTLPATVVGTSFLIVNGNTSGSITISVSPNSVDKIMGNGFTSADNKDAVLTNGKYGDFIKLVGDGVNGWFVAESTGTWTREA